MYLLFLLGRYLHVVAVEVVQIGIGIGWCRESFALKLYRSQREYGVATVHYAVAVVDEYVRHVCTCALESEGCLPHQFAELVTCAEVEQLGYSAPRILMRMMQYRIATRHVLAILAAERTRHIGIVDHGEDVDKQTLAVVEREVFIALYVERVEVAHLHACSRCRVSVDAMLMATPWAPLQQSDVHRPAA